MTDSPLPSDDPVSDLEALAAAAGAPVEVIGAGVLRVAAIIDDSRGGVEAHLRDTARELLELRQRVVKLEALVLNHHRLGLFEGIRPGENCPACEPGASEFVERLSRIMRAAGDDRNDSR